MLGAEIILDQGKVAEVTPDNSDAEIAEARKQALAETVTLRKEITKTEEASQGGGAALVLDALSNAVLPGIHGAAELIGAGIAYMDDRSANQPGAPRNQPVSFDQHIEISTKMVPGVYTTAAGNSVYGGDPKTAKDLSSNLSERMEIARISLTPPAKTGLVEKDTAKNFSGTQIDETKKILPAAQSAKQLLWGREIASRKALESTYVAQQRREAAIGYAKQMAPGMNQNFAPKRTQSLMSEAYKYEDETKAS